MGERAYLPDTHVLIWLVAQKQIPEHILRVLDADAQILVSAVSVYEVRFKQHLERLDLPALRSRRDWDDLFVGLDAIDLDITVDHASTAAALDWPHRDPWDRILAAQAIVERATLITKDRAFAEVPGLSVLWW